MFASVHLDNLFSSFAGNLELLYLLEHIYICSTQLFQNEKYIGYFAKMTMYSDHVVHPV